MKFQLSVFILILICHTKIYAQVSCNTEEYHNGLINTSFELAQLNGSLHLPDSVRAARLSSLIGTIIIPVKIHVVYFNETQKISEELIKKQIDQLNLDFAGQSPDTVRVPSCFKPWIADCNIYFSLKGIDYRKTTEPSFDCSRYENQIPANDKIKFHSLGGIDGASSTQFLNIWIGNIRNGSDPKTLLGYATYPYSIGTYDGIVIHYKAIGPGGLFPNYGGGKSLTHEVGHWLNLRHIWGDAECGDDTIDDTPRQQASNSVIPPFPRLTCDNTPNGDMYVNFMDYTYDIGRAMFTIKQRERMREQFIEGGFRANFVQDASINFLSVLDTTERKDLRTPVLTNVADIKDNIPAPPGSKIITWTKVKSSLSYLLLMRELGRSTIDTVVADENFATVTNLKKSKIYVVTISAVNKQGEQSVESVPYLFRYLEDPKRKIAVQ